MHFYKIFRASLLRILALLLLVAVLLPAPAFSLDSEDSQMFISGFNAYQRKDFKAAIENMSELLKKYPDTPLKDMAIFWLARAEYKAGHQQEAAKHMAQFFREYPESPLKGTVEEGLVTLAGRYQKGEPLDAAPQAAANAPAPGQAVAGKLAAEPAAIGDLLPEKVETAVAGTVTKAAAGRAAAKKLAGEVASEKAVQKRLLAVTKKVRPEKRTKSARMRDRAIKAYEGVIDKYPGTAAAATASAKLHLLGVGYPTLHESAATTPRQGEVSQVFNLEVAQYGDLKAQVGPAPETQEAGRRFSIPIEIANAGNGNDSFYLESGFPPEFDFHFAAATAPDIPIKSTPNLAVGEKFGAVAVGTMPRGNIDGQKNAYPVKIVSAFAGEVSQSREIALVTSAPLLRAVLKSDKVKLLPGEKISYRISLLNIGTAAARDVSLRLNYPPQYEPADLLPTGFKQQLNATLVLDGLRLASGASRDFNLTFRLKDEALADQELFLRVDAINNDLDKKESFVSGSCVVQRVSGVAARSMAKNLLVIPGQIVSIPIIVTNTGNLRDKFTIKANIPGPASYTFFEDLNRDGKRQPNEPVVNRIGPLSPKEEAYVVLEIVTPLSANDGAVVPVSVFFEPENAAGRFADVHLQLTYSRPVLALEMSAKGGRLKPGEVASLDLNCVNSGSSMARQVTLQSILPSQLELVASDPLFSKADSGVYTWRFDELGAGEKRNIKVTYRVKPGIAVGTNVQLKNLLTYQDQLGNRY